MTNNEYNPLDEYLQEKVENAPMLFREEYWDKMSGLLDEEDKNKKKPFLWRGLSILAVLLTLGLGAYVFPKLKKAPQQESVTPKTESTDQQTLPSVNQDIPESQQNVSASNNTSSSNTPTNNQPEVSKSQDQAQQSLLGTSTSIQENIKNQANTFASKNESSVKNKVSSTNTTSNPENQKTSQLANRANINTTSTNQTSATTKQSNVASHQTVSNSKASTKDNLASLPKNGNSPKRKNEKNKQHVVPTSTSTDNAESNQSTANTKNLREANQSMEGQSLASQTAKVVNIHGKSMIQMDSANFTHKTSLDVKQTNPRYVAGLGLYTPEVLDSIVLTYKPAETTDQAAEVQSVQNNSIEQVKEKGLFTPKPISFFIGAGLNMNKGFKGNVESPISWGFAPFVSAGFEKAISSKITMASQVGFTYFNGLNTMKKVTNYNYSFGFDSTQLSVVHKKLFQIYLPVSLYYQVMNNHFLMASIGASYSLDVSSSVKDNQTANATNKNGYSTGFNPFDFFVGAGYGYQLTNRIMIQLNIQQGFMDMTKNTYFNNTNKNTQTRLSVGLKYSFSRNEP